MQTALGKRYALTNLRDRMASLCGEIDELERKLEWIKGQRVHLAETIKFMSPGYDIDSIRPSKPRKRFKLFAQGALSGALADVLREANEPLTTEQVVTGVMKELKAKEDARVALRPRVRASLQYLLTYKQMITKIGNRRTAKWKLRR